MTPESLFTLNLEKSLKTSQKTRPGELEYYDNSSTLNKALKITRSLDAVQGDLGPPEGEGVQFLKNR